MMTFSSDPQLAEKQMQALLFYLTAFGYIDGDFDLSEKAFIRDYVKQLVTRRVDSAPQSADPALRTEMIHKYTTHFLEVFQEIDYSIRSLFTEAVATGEDLDNFVYAKLKLRSYEIFQAFDADNQKALLETVDDLIAADGVTHPAEAKFRDEIRGLLDGTIIPMEELSTAAIRTHVGATTTPQARVDNHPFFNRLEEHYSTDRAVMDRQARADLGLIRATMDKFNEQRRSGAGKLSGKNDVGEFAGQEPFLDGHVYVHPSMPDKRSELIVLGDLHGCYSCLKAALMQSDFFAKVQAFRDSPEQNPDVKLVLLGDYIDRGQYSYNGILRTIMQLFLTVPDHVYMLRGNHEYYLKHRGQVFGGVRPAEAINTLMQYMPKEMFEAYLELFESMPNMLFFDRTLFVHAGIPRDELLDKVWKDLSSLNNSDIRFQMLWSDPSAVDMVPRELQKDSARFPFGRLQFRNFMAKTGGNTLIRGHEKVEEGFRTIYDDGAVMLLNLFSAGGRTNDDLPPESSYRAVTPMALTIMHHNGENKITPWVIDYARYNSPDRNAFFKVAPEIEFKAE